MKRSMCWVVATIAIIALMAAVGSGNQSSRTAAATAEATVQATEEATQQAPAANATAAPTQSDSGPLTFVSAPLPTSGAVGITLAEGDQPIRLQSVTADSPAAKAGLQTGDEVVALNGQPVKDRQSLISMITAAKPNDVLTFTIRRGGKQQDVKVTASTRAAVYCPLPAPTGKPGKSLAKNPLDDPINWVMSSGSAADVTLVVGNGQLSFETDNPDLRWQAMATLKTNRVAEFIYSVDVTQTSQSIAGLVFNYRASAGFYLLQILPNGSWSMSSLFSDGSSAGGLSFTEPALKTADLKDPNATVTNTVIVQIQDNNIYFIFNGKFTCGTQITQFGDPPLQSGQVGIFAVVGQGKSGVSISNLKLTDVQKAAS